MVFQGVDLRKKIHGMLLGLLAVLFVVSGTLTVRQLRDYQAGEQAYDLAEEIATQTTPEPAPTPEPTAIPEEVPESPEEDVQKLMNLNLEKLRKTNEDVLGWICIPTSEINYPLLRVRDNNEYLRRAWDGSDNNVGCIFLECRNSHDFSDFNTIIYGHYMKNGTMFGSLHSYKEQEYADSHPCVYIVTDEGVRRYEVFSVYEADVVSDTYRLYFEDEAQKSRVLDYYVESSVMKRGAVPTVEDHVLTLSTCMGTDTYDTRWVVQAVLIEEFPRTKE